jgi:hypothetical protein
MALRGQFVFVPLQEAVTPAEGHCFVDRWWAYCPEKQAVLFYVSSSRLFYNGEPLLPSPQCNRLEYVARRLQQRLYPAGDVVFLPVVYESSSRKYQEKLVWKNETKRNS